MASKLNIFVNGFLNMFRNDIFSILDRNRCQSGSPKLDLFKEFSGILPPSALPEHSWNKSASPTRFLIDSAPILVPKSTIFHELACRLWVSFCHHTRSHSILYVDSYTLRKIHRLLAKSIEYRFPNGPTMRLHGNSFSSFFRKGSF